MALTLRSLLRLALTQYIIMESLQLLLLQSGFERTDEPLPEKGWICHAVAGAGKTHLLRTWLKRNHWARVHTTQHPDPPDQAGRHITDIIPEEVQQDGLITVLDEYGQSTWIPGYHAYFTDPLQAVTVRRAHFTNRYSRRVPKVVTSYLRLLGYDIHSHPELSLEGTLTLKHLYQGLQGYTVTEGGSAHKLVAESGAPHVTYQHSVGKEWQVVTAAFQTIDKDSSPELRRAFYIAATRTLRALHVRYYIPDTSQGELQSSAFDSSCRVCHSSGNLVREEERAATRWGQHSQPAVRRHLP